MPMINGRFYSAYGRYSAYATLQIQRYRMAAVRQQAEQNLSAIAGMLGDATINLVQGMGQITAQRALARISDEAKAKADKTSQAQAKADNIITQPATATYTPNPDLIVAGGAQVNLAANTLQLADGTLIDLATGLKIDVTA
jgi:predicted NodU family carbamoyl transferase